MAHTDLTLAARLGGAVNPAQRRWALLTTLAVLNVLDLVTTHIVLANGGREHNPVMQGIVEEVWSGAAVKALCLALVAVVALRCPARTRLPECALAAACAWYLLVVVWNVTVIGRLA